MARPAGIEPCAARSHIKALKLRQDHVDWNQKNLCDASKAQKYAVWFHVHF